MGTFRFYLQFDGDTVVASEGLPPRGLLTLFREDDRLNGGLGDEEDDDAPYVPLIGYKIPAWQLAQRLDVMGFTLSETVEDMEDGLRSEILELEHKIEQETELLAAGLTSRPSATLRRTRNVLRSMTLKRWARAMGALRHDGLLYDYRPIPTDKRLTPLQRYILTTQDDWEAYHHGFPTSDIRFLVRALLTCARTDEEVLLDLSELVVIGDLDENGQPASDAIEEMVRLGRACEKILVLTEGRSDTRILERTMKAFFPHLAHLYSFLDHEAFRFGGGTGNVFNLLKGIAGAGIGNRVIALFDNDAAGVLQAKEAADLGLPENYRVLTLPNLRLGNRYPTLGPNGSLWTNINGCACSIELYLGAEALNQEDGTLLPVQWKGFQPRLNRYQGEVLNKKDIHNRFFRSLKTRDQGGDEKFSDIRAVLQVILAAFANETRSP